MNRNSSERRLQFLMGASRRVDTTFDIPGCRIVDALVERHIVQLLDLYAGEWWTSERQLEDVRVMLEHTPIVIGILDIATDDLVGFARVLTDLAYSATLLDVIVRADHRGRGIGNLLLATATGHPSLGRVRRINLKCRNDMVAFYERWGFEVRVQLPTTGCQGPGAEMVRSVELAPPGSGRHPTALRSLAKPSITGPCSRPAPGTRRTPAARPGCAAAVDP